MISALKLTRVIEPRKGLALSWRPWKMLPGSWGNMRPWRQARPYWDYAAELVLIAATTGRMLIWFPSI
jgi:hypothetical protein